MAIQHENCFKTSSTFIPIMVLLLHFMHITDAVDIHTTLEELSSNLRAQYEALQQKKDVGSQKQANSKFHYARNSEISASGSRSFKHKHHQSSSTALSLSPEQLVISEAQKLVNALREYMNLEVQISQEQESDLRKIHVAFVGQLPKAGFEYSDGHQWIISPRNPRFDALSPLMELFNQLLAVYNNRAMWRQYPVEGKPPSPYREDFGQF